MRRRFNPLTILLLVGLLSGCTGSVQRTSVSSLSLADAYRTVLSTLTMSGE